MAWPSQYLHFTPHAFDPFERFPSDIVSVCLNQDISRRILNEEPIMPSYVSTEAIDLMHKLLVKDPTKRLGESLIAFIGPCAYKIYENHSWEKLIEHKSSKEIQHLIGASEIKLQEIAL